MILIVSQLLSKVLFRNLLWAQGGLGPIGNSSISMGVLVIFPRFVPYHFQSISLFEEKQFEHIGSKDIQRSLPFLQCYAIPIHIGRFHPPHRYASLFSFLCLYNADVLSDSCDINVSPDKRTIFLHSEGNLLAQLKVSSFFQKLLSL